MWTSLWCRSDKFQLSVLTAGMRGRFFRALHTGAGPGVVSTGHRDTASMIRCIIGATLDRHGVFLSHLHHHHHHHHPHSHTHHHHHQTSRFKVDQHQCGGPGARVWFSRVQALTLAASHVVAGRDSGAARRRRERRLRSAWRQEQLSVAMALAAASHHSAQQDGAPRSLRTATRAREGEVRVMHVGLRAQKRPLPGTRPEPLEGVSEPQVVDAVTSYVAAPGPSSLVPRLAANDALDNAALKFLVARALLDRREQEEERSKKEEEVKKQMKVWLEQRTAEGRRELERSLDSGSASSKRKKKKKRRKKKTPRGSLPRRACRCRLVSGCCLRSTPLFS